MIDWKGKIPAIAFLALSSCSSGPSEVNGNLGNGTFSYTCVSTEDPACATGDGDIFTNTPSTTAAVFPTTVASGGRFKLAYQANNSSAAGNPSIRPVSPAILDSSSGLNGEITAVRAGKDGLVVRSSVDGDVFDFTYITVAPISSVGIIDSSGGAPPSQITLSDGDKLTYVASALGPHGEKLAGAVDYTWTVDNPALLTLGEGNPTAKIDVTKGTGTGTAHLTVTQGTLTQTLTIEVQ
ncbi:MAG: hypothetical protein ACRELY_23965 [Polyangiaceae bacterium]